MTDNQTPDDEKFRKVISAVTRPEAVAALKDNGIESLVSLVNRSPKELVQMANFGRKSLNEIVGALTDMGLSLRQEPVPAVAAYGNMLAPKERVECVSMAVALAERDRPDNSLDYVVYATNKIIEWLSPKGVRSAEKAENKMMCLKLALTTLDQQISADSSVLDKDIAGHDGLQFVLAAANAYTRFVEEGGWTFDA